MKATSVQVRTARVNKRQLALMRSMGYELTDYHALRLARIPALQDDPDMLVQYQRGDLKAIFARTDVPTLSDVIDRTINQAALRACDGGYDRIKDRPTFKTTNAYP